MCVYTRSNDVLSKAHIPSFYMREFEIVTRVLFVTRIAQIDSVELQGCPVMSASPKMKQWTSSPVPFLKSLVSLSQRPYSWNVKKKKKHILKSFISCSQTIPVYRNLVFNFFNKYPAQSSTIYFIFGWNLSPQSVDLHILI